MNSISLDEVLTTMNQLDKFNKPVPFRITAVTCDLNRNRGGERLEYAQAVLCSPDNGKGRKHYHNRNDVRNVRSLGNQEIRGIHPILITHFNGREVTL